MTESKFSFRITDPTLPSGQILASDLAKLVEGLQGVAQRITRDLAGASARGRTPQQRSDASQIMMTGLASGSTVLDFVLGNPNTLDLPGATDAQISEEFEAITAGIAGNTPPPFTSTPVAHAARDLTVTLRKSFPGGTFEFTTGTQRFEAVISNLNSEVWDVPTESVLRRVVVSGILNRVDLRTNTFRITDTAGNDITLSEVAHPEQFGPLVGTLVAVEGQAEFSGDKLVEISAPKIESLEMPPAWRTPEPFVPIQTGGVIHGGISGVTEQEIHEFLSRL